MKTRKPYPPPKSFLCGPHFLGKEKFCTGAGRCVLSLSQQCQISFKRPRSDLEGASLLQHLKIGYWLNPTSSSLFLRHRWPSTGVKKASPQKTPKKVRKGVPGAFRPRGRRSSKKIEKKVEKGPKTRKNLKNGHFRLFFGFFFDPGAERPRESLFRPFRSFLGISQHSSVTLGERTPESLLSQF